MNAQLRFPWRHETGWHKSLNKLCSWSSLAKRVLYEHALPCIPLKLITWEHTIDRCQQVSKYAFLDHMLLGKHANLHSLSESSVYSSHCLASFFCRLRWIRAPLFQEFSTNWSSKPPQLSTRRNLAEVGYCSSMCSNNDINVTAREKIFKSLESTCTWRNDYQKFKWSTYKLNESSVTYVYTAKKRKKSEMSRTSDL